MGFSRGSQFRQLHKASHWQSQLLETPWITSWLMVTKMPPNTAYSVKGWVPFLCVLPFHATRSWNLSSYNVYVPYAQRWKILCANCLLLYSKAGPLRSQPFYDICRAAFPKKQSSTEKKKDQKPFLRQIRNIADTLFNENFQLLLFHLYFPL